MHRKDQEGNSRLGNRRNEILEIEVEPGVGEMRGNEGGRRLGAADGTG